MKPDGGELEPRGAFTTVWVAKSPRARWPRHSPAARAPRQAEIGSYKPDFLWPAQFLIVETDGHETHGTRFEEDRARDAELKTMGNTVLRFTWLQLTERPEWVAQTVFAALRV